MLAQHQNTAYTANKHSNKTIASTSIPTSLPLPPALTSHALSSLCRLPLSNSTTLTWERFDCGTNEDAKDARLAHEALLQVVLAEGKALEERSDSDDQSSSALTGRTLWAIERDPALNAIYDLAGSISSIWIFTLHSSEAKAEIPAAGLDDKSRHVIKCKEMLKRRLSRYEARKESGHCCLQDFYSPIASTSLNDPTLLSPSAGRERLLHNFLKALKEYHLFRWVWTDNVQKRPVVTLSSIDRRTRKEAQRERDDEEEGAIDDSKIQRSKSPIINEYSYWPSSQHFKARKVTRFADGVILRSSRNPNAIFAQDTINDSKVTYLTIRCFLDEKGYIYVETRPVSAYNLQYVESDEVSNRQAMLAPTALRATLIESLQGVNWSDKIENFGDKEIQRELSECKQALLKMLEVRGIDIEELGEEWTICESETKSRFLWPTRLCFAIPSDDDSKDISKASLQLTIKPLRDIAERAKGLVKESMGVRNTISVEDDVMLDVDSLEESRGKEEEVEDDNEDKMDDQDEEADQQEVIETKMDVVSNFAESGKNQQSDPQYSDPCRPDDDSKAIHSSKEDDENDLWDTFGFGSQQDHGKDSGRRQSIAGMDEGGFGLITEDDFDFFDAAVGSFDDMDVDMGQQEEANAAGDLTAQFGDAEDNSPEQAMTNSTFIDPPSLPGFTPGSLSATSPAVGGLNAKTPRTPFSPSQDLVDANIAIEGEGDSTFLNEPRHFDHRSEGLLHNQVDVDALNTRQAGAGKSNVEDERQYWISQSRGDLMSKYEQGKFAMPLTPARRRIDIEDGIELNRAEKESAIAPRNRLRNRFHHARRSSGVKLLLSRKSRFGALSLRNEEENSDLDATIDGTISERSSIMDDGSDGELTSASEDNSEEEVILLKERLDLLRVSLDILEIVPVLPRKAKTENTSEEPEFDPIKDAEITRSLKRLANNPQFRLAVSSPHDKGSEVLIRSLTRQLFTPLPKVSFDNNLGLLLFGSNSKEAIQVLEPPQIMIGCQGSIATMESAALSYWEKLGLSAVSGPKEVAAMGLHCGCLPSSWQKELLEWFDTFNDTYKRNGLGNQTLIEDALLALGESHDLSIAQILVHTHKHAEQWTDTLESLLSRMQSPLSLGNFVVIYALGLQVIPGNLWILSRLEKDLQDLAQSRWGISPELINVRGIAWSTMANSTRAMAGVSHIRRIALSIYDSLDVPITPNHNLKSHLPHIKQESVGVLHPSFTLSPIEHLTRSNIQFQLQWKSEPFNLTDTGLLLHVAYHVASVRGQLSFVAIMDEKAQGYSVEGWRRRGALQGELEHIWNHVQNYTKKARILWRIVICREGQMETEEVKGWYQLLDSVPRSLKALDITLTCIDTLTPFSVVLPRPGRGNGASLDNTASAGLKQAKEVDNRTTHFINAKQVDYAIFPPFRIAMCRDTDDNLASTILPLQSSAIVSFAGKYNGSVPCTDSSSDSSWSQAASRHFWIHILQVYQAPYSHYQAPISLENRMDIITRNFHNLMFIAKERFLLTDNLPWHISMLAAARRAHLLF